MSGLSTIKSIVFVLCFYLVSCATITVNVYFPAEEVTEAYSSLEDEFLGPPSAEANETAEPSGEDTDSNAPGPQGKVNYSNEPVLVSEEKVIVLTRKFSLDLGSYAWAQGNISGQIEQKIRNMPDVVNAYKRRGQRRNIINSMLSQRKVAEGNNGLLVKKGSLNSQESQAFGQENKDRQIIINGMARAIVEINNVQPTPENIEKVLPRAASQFADMIRKR